MGFQVITEVRVEHEYFNGLFSGFEIRPNAATQKVLSNYGLICKAKRSSVSIFFDKSHAGKNRNNEDLLKQNLLLYFSLELSLSDFMNYTANLAFRANQKSLYFSNSKIDRANLHQEEFVGEKNIYNAPLRIFCDEGLTRPLGKIALRLRAGLLPVYHIRFEALATYWRYILTDTHLAEIECLKVSEKDSQKTFNGPFPIILPSKKIALSFISPNPIKLSNNYITRYQLTENDGSTSGKSRVLIRALPYPNPLHISVLPQQEEHQINQNYSEIII